MRMLLLALFGVLAAHAAHADVVHLKNGGTIEGVVLSESDEAVTIRMKYGSARIAREEIDSVEKAASAPATAVGSARLAGWEHCVTQLSRTAWGKEFRQIPATVVDKGVLAFVPYMSHAAGDYEFNLYGDPDAPSCIEIGVRKDLLRSDEAKKGCVEFICSLLGDPKDQEFLRTLSFAADKKQREGLTFEVTPETAEDAYGGWWISIYDEAEVAKQRATEEELKQITITKEELKKEEEARKAEEAKRKATAEAAKKANQPPPALSAPSVSPYAWDARDFTYSHPRTQNPAYYSTVYVRGIHRTGGGYRAIRGR